jgi:hypothetical protein
VGGADGIPSAPHLGAVYLFGVGRVPVDFELRQLPRKRLATLPQGELYQVAPGRDVDQVEDRAPVVPERKAPRRRFRALAVTNGFEER